MIEPKLSFRTKTGTCSITADQIILTRAGVRGGLSQFIFGSSITRAIVMYSILGLIGIFAGIQSLRVGDNLIGPLLIVIGLYFFWVVIASRNNSASPVIARSAIKRIEVHAPKPPLTRGYFTVLFDEGGKLRKRLIILPGSMEDGSTEYQHAKTVLTEAGLL